MNSTSYFAVVPAAGIGQRMGSQVPKQYLKIGEQTLLEHTLNRLITHPRIQGIILALHPEDSHFEQLPISNAPWIQLVQGGDQRADSVLAGLTQIPKTSWVLVHDAVRPNIKHQDLDKLLSLANTDCQGGLLACRVKDTMKRTQNNSLLVSHTESRDDLWHALTPQFFPTQLLYQALLDAKQHHHPLTDEASAMELAGYHVAIVESCASNIKVTTPEDLPLIQFYLEEKQV
jgi:2-C-methyl-D-erythritol 4-phosphate cytidylyltransferase